MKHILNNLSDEEKNSIREQHTGGMNVVTENFNRLLGSKLGDVKPLVSEQTIASNILSGSSQKAVKQVFDSCANASQSPYNTNKIVDGIYRAVQGIGTDESSILAALTATRDLNTFCSAVKNYKTTYGVDLYSDLDGDIDEETLWAQISRILRNLKPTAGAKPTGGVPQKPMTGAKPTGGVKPTGGAQRTNPAVANPTGGVKPTGGAQRTNPAVANPTGGAQRTNPAVANPTGGAQTTPQPALTPQQRQQRIQQRTQRQR
jgi:hypothetical protein